MFIESSVSVNVFLDQIKNLARDRGLRVAKLADANFARVLETCIMQGLPLLVESVLETLDPILVQRLVCCAADLKN